MKIGFLFPGQGVQNIGMGKDLYEEYEEYRNVYEEVKKITGIDVAKITFESTEEELSKTKNTQIAILTMSLAILAILKKENIQDYASMGLSLGEYTALINSEYMSVKDGIEIVKKRGELMQKYCPKGEWSMAAIIGLDAKKVEEACKQVKKGFVKPANYNCTGQIVISGEKEAVKNAMEEAKNLGARKTIELNTSGPFHTEKLKKASEQLKKELEKIEIEKKNKIVIKNIDGAAYEEKDNIKEILEKHIINPVRFDIGIQTMLDIEIDTFIEIGPGKTLSGFVKRTNKNVAVLNINDRNSLYTTIKYIKEKGVE